MGKWPSPTRKTLVEECEVIAVSAALSSPAANGISRSASVSVAVVASVDGFPALRAGGACSNSIVLLVQTSSLVANVTISRTGVCKSMISAWIGW